MKRPTDMTAAPALREDLELVMRVLAHRHVHDKWRQYEWGPMPELPSVDVAREVLREVEAKLKDDNRSVSEDGPSGRQPIPWCGKSKHSWEVRDGFKQCKNCPAIGGRAG